MKTPVLAPRAFIALFALAACGDGQGSSPPTPDAGLSTSRAVVVAGTFTPGEPGVMSALDVGPLAVDPQVAPNGAIAEDPVMRRVGDELFVINRASGNNVTILDANNFGVREQLATGEGSNPQDIAVVGDKLYVPAFGTAGVVVLTRDSTDSALIDLSSLDPDGQPNCVSAFAVDTDVYVACELLDENFAARGPGKVVVIDSATDAVRATLTMTNNNPFGLFERVPAELGGDLGDQLVIPTVPDFGDPTVGCVEAIVPGATPTAAGCVVPNAELAGFPSRIAFQQLGPLPVMWLVTSRFDTEAHGALQAFDLEEHCLWDGSATPATQLVLDVAVCPDGYLVIADQTADANGLRVYDGTAELTTAPLPFGLKPSSPRGLECY